MMIEATAATATIAATAPETYSPQKATAADKIKENREEQQATASKDAANADEKDKVQSEELLDKIKALQDDGRYSVRFEKNDDIRDTIVKVWDIENDELIRQFPVEELVDFKTSFKDLVGNIVDTKG